MARHQLTIMKMFALAAVSATALATANTAVASAEPVTTPCRSQQQSVQEQLTECPLLEFATPDGRGSFYTIYRDEADSAGEMGFTEKPDAAAAGIRLSPSQQPGMVPLYRLRFRGDHMAYLVTSSAAERASLSGRQFQYEGVMAYVYSPDQPQPAGTMKLCRYSKDGDWRLARESRGDLLLAGYRDECASTADGGPGAPQGYVPAG